MYNLQIMALSMAELWPEYEGENDNDRVGIEVANRSTKLELSV